MAKRRKLHDESDNSDARQRAASRSSHIASSSSAQDCKQTLSSTTQQHSTKLSNNMYANYAMPSKPVNAAAFSSSNATSEAAYYIPLPIQNFLWRQTSPFVKPLLGKARDSTQMEQREACKSFEKVMVQNNIFGQSPSLTDAIGNINRWQLIKTAFPFVLQCTASLLTNKKSKDQNFNKLGACETKLMYTLHWILMDAAEECADSENELARQKTLSALAESGGANLLKPNNARTCNVQVGSANSARSSTSEQQMCSSQSLATVAAAVASAAAAPQIAPSVATASPIINASTTCHQSQLHASSSSGGVSNVGASFVPSASPSSSSTCGLATCNSPPPLACASNYLLPISSIQMFVYWFAPMIESLKHSEFLTSFRLENGAKLWEPLFEYKLANIKCLTTAIKPFAAASRELSSRKHSSRSSSSTRCNVQVIQHQQQRPQLQATASNASDDERIATLTQPTSTLTNQRRKSSGAAPELLSSPTLQDYEVPQIKLATPLDSAQQQFGARTSTSNSNGAQNVANLPYATYMDVAVLRCLFEANWCESAVYWALAYLSNRLECAHYDTDFERLLKPQRVRSKSLSAAACSAQLLQSLSCKVLEPVVSVDNCSIKQSATELANQTNNTRSTNAHLLRVDGDQQQQQQGDGRSPVRRLSFTTGMQSLANQLKKSKKAKKGDESPARSSRCSSSNSNEDVSMRDVEIDTEMTLADCEGQQQQQQQSTNKPNVKHSIQHSPASIGKQSNVKLRHQQQQQQPQSATKPTSSEFAQSAQNFLIQQIQADSLRRFERLVRSQSVPASLHIAQFATKDAHQAHATADANAASLYADAEGRIDLVVVLKVLRAVSEREFVCSHRVCDKLESLIVRLLSYGMLKRQFLLARRRANKQREYEAKGQTKRHENLLVTFARSSQLVQQFGVPSLAARKQKALNALIDVECATIHKTFVAIAFNLLTRLGCPNSCANFEQNVTGEQLQLRLGQARQQQLLEARNLRARADELLEHLCAHNTQNFTNYARELVQTKQLSQIIATLHCVLGFCRSDYIASAIERHKSQPTTTANCLLTPSASGSNLSQSRLSESLNSPRLDCQSQQQSSGETAKTAFTFHHTQVAAAAAATATQRQLSAESRAESAHRAIVGSCFKLLVSRMALVSKELCSNDNISLFCDVRRFISCVRDNYASIFRACVLSPMIDCAKLVNEFDRKTKIQDKKQQQQQQQQHPLLLSTKQARTCIVQSLDGKENDNITASAEHATRSEFNEQIKTSKLISAESLGSSPMDTTTFVASSKSKFSRLTDNTQEQQQQQQQQQQQGASILSFSKAKRKLEQVFGASNLANANSSTTRAKQDADCDSDTNSADINARNQKQNSSPATQSGGKFKKRRSRSQQQVQTQIVTTPVITKSVPFTIDSTNVSQLTTVPQNIEMTLHYQRTLSDIRRGIASFSFLMESCAPGDLLDAAMLAALLDLNGPIAVRAAIYLECANFVHRCNRGQWPSWMRISAAVAATAASQQRPSSAGLAAATRQAKSSMQRTARNNTLLYKAAGRAFYAWAEAVGARLEELLQADVESQQQETQSPASPLSATLNAGGASTPADYLRSTINGKSSPFALRLAACQLLLEVTAFLRETCRYLPPTVSHAQQALSARLGEKMASIYDVSRAVTANRRWSMALSSLGFGQLPASLSAISASTVGAATASSSTEYPDRRISFVLHETNDENDYDDDDNNNNNNNNGNNDNDSQTRMQAVGGVTERRISGATSSSTLVNLDSRSATRNQLAQASASNAVATATCLLRSSGVIEAAGSHRRKSIKLRKPSEQTQQTASNKSSAEGGKRAKFAHEFDEELEASIDGATSMRRSDSMRSKRRVSGLSERSDTSDGCKQHQQQQQQHHQAHQSTSSVAQVGTDASGADSPINASDDEPFASSEHMGAADRNAAAAAEAADESRLMSNMPWFRAISLVNKSIDCSCLHAPACKRNCFKSEQEACRRLVAAVQLIYDSSIDDNELGEYAAASFDARISECATTAQQSASVNATTTRTSGEMSAQISADLQTSNDNEKVKASKKRDKKAKKAAAAAAAAAAAQAAGTNTDNQQQQQQQLDFCNSISNQAAKLNAAQFAPSFAMLMRKKALHEKKLNFDKLDERPQMLRYIQASVRSLLHCPMSTLLKGAVILPRESFVEMLTYSWNLLLDDDQLLAKTAAVTFIVSAVRCPSEASKLLLDELDSSDAARKVAAMSKFYAIWDSRYQCWHKMEEGAYMHFKMAPPSIEFTLPSPKIAQESMAVVDPPWQPRKTSKVEEATINQDQTVQKSFVTATKTRRKQQIELVTKALREKYDKLREERQEYNISTVPITYHSAYEPTLGHQTQISSENGDVDVSGAGNNSGVANTNSSNATATNIVDVDDSQAENRALYHMKMAHALFPTSLCQGAIILINLLEDSRVTYDGSAVYETASKVIWCCLVEDPALFLRHFFERLTRQNQSTIFQVIRRLIRFMPRLPHQAAYTLYNYLIGFIIFYIRCPVESSQKLISDTLSVLCLVVPSVYGLFLKDLKQILRKEQCDHNLLITANVPAAKKIIVHGSDSSGIPSQFPIDESTQFYHILIDSLEFFGIEREKQNDFFLLDCRTNQMHNLQSYVRDFYSFKRSQHPQLQLVNMDPSKAFDSLQRQELVNQFMEFGKVSMAFSIVKSPHMALQRVLFLHEELMKLPTFPRKCLETKFHLFRGIFGRQIMSMDRMHKACWVRLFARMFEVTANFFLQLADIHLFLNTICGVFVLHCDEVSVTRLCLSTFINAAYQFKNIFASDGFVPIMPTIVQVYSNHQNNALLARSIEFACKQFYIMHRKPFMLQLFGSVAPLLNTVEVMQQITAANKPLAIASQQMLSQLRNAGNALSGVSNANSSSGTSDNNSKSQQACSSSSAATNDDSTPQVHVQSPSTSGNNLMANCANQQQQQQQQHSPTALPVSNSCSLLTNLSNNININSVDSNPMQISPLAFFKLLQSLEKSFKDPLDILELVEAEKPLKALDFCYQNDKETIEILDIISLCVTVTAYASDSPRSTQMLIILDAVVPLYMKHLQATSTQRRVVGKPTANKSELQKIQAIAVCIRTLIVNCEGLTRNFSGPQRAIDFRSSSIRRDRRSAGNQQQQQQRFASNDKNNDNSQIDNYDELSATDIGLPPIQSTRLATSSKQATRDANVKRATLSSTNQLIKTTSTATTTTTTTTAAQQQASQNQDGKPKFANARRASCDESDLSRAEFVLARGTLLNLVAEFLALSSPRLVESMKKLVEMHQKHQSFELLDTKSHLRLAEIANSLLKLASVDPSVMSCRGLIRYMNEIVPNTEWRQEQIRPALIMILKRLDKTFNRISKKTWIKRSTDWDACKQLLKGAYLTFVKHPYIVHLPHLKSLISCCQNIIIGESNLLDPMSSVGISSAFTNSSLSTANQQQQTQQATSSTNSFHALNALPSALNSTAIGVAVASASTTTTNASASASATAAATTTATANEQQQQQQLTSNSTGSSSASNNSQLAASNHQQALVANQGQQSSGVSSFALIASTIAASTRQQNNAAPSLAAISRAATLAERIASSSAPPSSQGFSLVTLRLIAMQLLHSSDGQTLESFVSSFIGSPEKLEATLLNLIYPMCIRVCSGARETPKLRANDISFVVNLVLGLLAPQSASAKSCNVSMQVKAGAAAETSQFILSKLQTTIGGGGAQAAASALGGIVGATAITGQSIATTQAQQLAKHPDAMRIGFLGLKIVCVCFEQHLANEWVRISRVVTDLATQASHSNANPALWDFLEFTANYRFPLFILLEPFIRFEASKGVSSAQATQLFESKRMSVPIECRNKSFAFVLLSAELRALKDQLAARRRIQLERGSANLRPSDWNYASPGTSQSQSAACNPATRQQSSSGANDSAGSTVGGEHFNAYHRLSAAIASLTSQSSNNSTGGVSSSQTCSQSASATSSGAKSASAALKGTCFAAQLATSAAPIVAPSVDNRMSQSSTRLSAVQNRDEARKVLNTLLRRTSLTGKTMANTRSALSSVDQNTAADSNSGKQSIDPAMLMASLPPKRQQDEIGSGILKSLINTIDRQNQKRASHCPPTTSARVNLQSEQTQKTTSFNFNSASTRQQLPYPSQSSETHSNEQSK